MKYYTSYVCLCIHLIPPKHTKVIYATKCLRSFLKDWLILIPFPLSYVCASSFLLPWPNDCLVLKIVRQTRPYPSFLGQSWQQEYFSERISPRKSRGRSPASSLRCFPQARFRWWRWLNEAPKMLLNVIMTRGWVLRCVWLLLEVF